MRGNGSAPSEGWERGIAQSKSPHGLKFYAIQLHYIYSTFFPSMFIKISTAVYVYFEQFNFISFNLYLTRESSEDTEFCSTRSQKNKRGFKNGMPQTVKKIFQRQVNFTLRVNLWLTSTNSEYFNLVGIKNINSNSKVELIKLDSIKKL